jgi:hypothetical protein
MPFRAIPSLAARVPAYQRRLAGWSVVLLAFLGLLVAGIVVRSQLRMS